MKGIWRILSGLWLLAVAVAGVSAPLPGSVTLAESPFIRDNIARENFEPGGKYHLFSSRGEIAERSGDIILHPVYSGSLGNLQQEKALIIGNISYQTRFSHHPHWQHSPFDEVNSRSGAASQGNAEDGFILYSMDWQGRKVHPADAYDGEQGSGYPLPTGARDEYSYRIRGIAEKVVPSFANLDKLDARTLQPELFQHAVNAKDELVHAAESAVNNLAHDRTDLSIPGNIARKVNVLVQLGSAPVQTALGMTYISDAWNYGITSGVNAAGKLELTYIGSLPTPGDKIQAVDRLISLSAYKDGIANDIQQTAAQYPSTVQVAGAGLALLPAYKPLSAAADTVASAVGNTVARVAKKAGRAESAAADSAVIHQKPGSAVIKPGSAASDAHLANYADERPVAIGPAFGYASPSPGLVAKFQNTRFPTSGEIWGWQSAQKPVSSAVHYKKPAVKTARRPRGYQELGTRVTVVSYNKNPVSASVTYSHNKPRATTHHGKSGPTAVVVTYNAVPGKVTTPYYNKEPGTATAAREQSGHKTVEPGRKALYDVNGKYTGGRTRAELDALAGDPSHIGSKRDVDIDKGIHERKVGLSLEESGKLKGPITRDSSGAAEFFDANGQAWDVKSFNSNYIPKIGGYTLEASMDSIYKSLAKKENVILDTTNLTEAHRAELLQEISKKGLTDRIIVWP